ncbi:MAG: PKD domain-containing protein [Candidatus Thalassarchaeaceae archaeon]|nr:PKD domain-containing protein [Candidatus Thalassarchaeaceae archaeon]
MPMVIDPLFEIECDVVARACAISPDGEWVSWSGDDGIVRLIEVNGASCNELESFQVEDAVTHIQISQDGMIVIGTHSGDLHGHERLGGHRWTHPIGGGCDHLSISEDGTVIACVDGGRNLHILTENGIVRGKFSSGELILLCVSDSGNSIAVADDEGTVHMLDNNGNLLWSRKCESEVGETISSFSILHDESLLLSREALGLTQGDIPQIALEHWSENGEKLSVEEIDSRAVCIVPEKEGALVGLFDGQVIQVNQNMSKTPLWRSMYAISDIKRCGNDTLIASWFHLHRIDGGGEESWRCEHTGLVDSIRSSKDGSRIAISGDNQNDYTRENRILILDPDSEPYLLSNDAGIDDDLLGFDEGSEVKTITAASDDDLYADGGDDIAALLTEEEREMFSEGVAPQIDDDLMMMLDDEIEQLAQMPETDGDDLMAGLTDDSAVENIAPTADAGYDQIVSADDTGTAIVLLDGSASIAGTHDIAQWSWRDGTSKQIGDTVKIKVKLSPGNHTFTLTVADSMRESTTDTITVQVEGSSSDDSFDLLYD